MSETLTAGSVAPAYAEYMIGDALGFPWLRGRPPSGRTVTWAQVHMFRVADGLLREHWAVRDDVRVLEAIDAPDES